MHTNKYIIKNPVYGMDVKRLGKNSRQNSEKNN